MIFHIHTPRHTQTNVAIYWYNKIRWFSIMITRHHKINLNYFSDENKIFSEHSGLFPPVVTFLSHFIKKLMLMLLLFLHSSLFEIVPKSSFYENCVELIDLWTKRIGWYTLLLCPVSSTSQIPVGREFASYRNPWIWFSNPWGNLFLFQYYVEWIIFPPKNYFVPLKFWKQI